MSIPDSMEMGTYPLLSRQRLQEANTYGGSIGALALKPSGEIVQAHRCSRKLCPL